MTTLKLKPWGKGGVSFSPPVPLPTNEAAAAWERIAVEFLLFALANRPACFVTDDERASSFPYADGLPDVDKIIVDNKTYLLAFIEVATSQRLKQLITSSEFRWDAVWIMPLRKSEVSRICKLANTLDLRAPEQIDEEIILSFGDGCGLEWHNPIKPIGDIVAELTKLTQIVGWCIDTDAVA